MVAEIFAGIGAFKTAFDIAKGLKDIDDASRRNAAVIELQEKILSAQQSQLTLIETIGQLEKEVASLKDWEAEKQRYELKALAPGVFAYALKPDMSNGEPPHYICANCCAAGKKSFLQQHVRGSYHDQFKCRGCGEELGFDKGTHPAAPVSIRPSRFELRIPYASVNTPFAWSRSTVKLLPLVMMMAVP